MAFKIFLDINILVDFIDHTREEHASADLLFKEMEHKKIAGFISESVINTTSYIVRKQTSVANFSRFTQHALRTIKVLSCTNNNILQACGIAINDFEDAVLYSIALSTKMDFFITNNKNDFKKIGHPSLPVITAEELLKML